MLKENVKKLLDELRTNHELFEKVKSVSGPEEVEKVIKEAGHDVTGAELTEAVEETRKEIAAKSDAAAMSVDNLEEAAGGENVGKGLNCYEYWYWNESKDGEKVGKNPLNCNLYWYWN